jgi:hypothetical protein
MCCCFGLLAVLLMAVQHTFVVGAVPAVMVAGCNARDTRHDFVHPPK